jgi:hypothetical protein
MRVHLRHSQVPQVTNGQVNKLKLFWESEVDQKWGLFVGTRREAEEQTSDFTLKRLARILVIWSSSAETKVHVDRRVAYNKTAVCCVMLTELWGT